MIDYEEDWLFSLVYRQAGSVGGRACLFALPAACMAVLILQIEEWLPGLREELGIIEGSNKSQIWSATTAGLVFLLGFRTNRAMSRFWEGTGLLHQMRGEWFDSVSCCVTFSRGAMYSKAQQVEDFRHTIVRLMSLCHGFALEEIAGNCTQLPTIDPYGLDNVTLTHLKACKEEYGFNRVEVLLHLTQCLITNSLDEGVLKIPPPILSRVYQTLSRGFVNLLNAKKITDTRFPFPYAQLISYFLLFHMLLTPVMLTSVFTSKAVGAALVTSKVMAFVLVFVPVFGMAALNVIAAELENPFGDDENDLPLNHFQEEMNACLIMLLQEDADLIPTVDRVRCTTNFDKLQDAMVHDSSDCGDAKHAPSFRRISEFDLSVCVEQFRRGEYECDSSKAEAPIFPEGAVNGAEKPLSTPSTAPPEPIKGDRGLGGDALRLSMPGAPAVFPGCASDLSAAKLETTQAAWAGQLNGNARPPSQIGLGGVVCTKAGGAGPPCQPDVFVLVEDMIQPAGGRQGLGLRAKSAEPDGGGRRCPPLAANGLGEIVPPALHTPLETTLSEPHSPSKMPRFTNGGPTIRGVPLQLMSRVESRKS
eukprot:TRINITY_DN9241_c0_g2_i1.p1 TRINITY_DN9241_c0_g2~~TRINITY_DN9241_c0_g2_i1.p1  ORF type:complete len:589 (-),score=116.94 TRINITY_DN9241_c0_g2_i1:35-1801(-)